MSKLDIRTYSSVTDTRYDEAEALNALQSSMLRALKIDEALNDEEDDEALPQQFTISIAGRSIAFYVGGPQIAGLEAFIESIATENMYSKDDEENWKGWE